LAVAVDVYESVDVSAVMTPAAQVAGGEVAGVEKADCNIFC
jgi:hypothetical protein